MSASLFSRPMRQQTLPGNALQSASAVVWAAGSICSKLNTQLFFSFPFCQPRSCPLVAGCSRSPRCTRSNYVRLPRARGCCASAASLQARCTNLRVYRVIFPTQKRHCVKKKKSSPQWAPSHYICVPHLFFLGRARRSNSS